MKIRKSRKTHSKRKSVKRRKTRRNPMMFGNPRRVKRHVRRRRNPGGFKKIGNKIPNILINGVAGIAGAAAVNIVTNGIVKLAGSFTKTPVSAATKNWLSLGSALLISIFLPKVKLVGKYSEAIASGAVVMAGINVIGNTFGMKKYLTLSGEDNPELDKIIANLNVDGENDMLLGYNGMMSGLNDMSGITDMSGYDDDLLGIDQEYDY